MTNQKLTLYHYRTCPFCIKVEQFLDEKALKVPIIYIDEDSKAFEMLYEKTGSVQAPCLQIGDEFMRESDDIIVFLGANS